MAFPLPSSEHLGSCIPVVTVLARAQYPDGDLQSFQIYRMNIDRLRAVIADAQPPPFPTAFLQPKVRRVVSPLRPRLGERFYRVALPLEYLLHCLLFARLSIEV